MHPSALRAVRAGKSRVVIPTVCLGCSDRFYGRLGQGCCSARCRAKAARDRRVQRLLIAAETLADWLPAAAQDAYDRLIVEIVGP